MFTIHGSWKIKVNNNVILQWIEGAWNEEAAIAYSIEFKEIASQLIGKSWAIISVLEEWQLCTPDIEKHIAEHAEWYIKNGCTHGCHIYTQNTLKKMQLDKMIPYTEENYERQVFGGITESIQWLESEGFELNNTEQLLEFKNMYPNL